MGLTDGRAPCKCMHGQPGIQGPPGPKVQVENLWEPGHTALNKFVLTSRFIHPQGHGGLPGAPGDAGRQGNWVNVDANYLCDAVIAHFQNIL